MRKVWITIMFVLVIIPAVMAQRPAASFFSGVNPGSISYQPVDTSRALTPKNLSPGYKPPSTSSSFKFQSLFPKLSLPSWPPRIPSKPVSKGNSFQPNIIQGKTPLDTGKK